MGIDSDEIQNGKKISKLEAEVHSINSSFGEFKDEMKGLVSKLFTKLEEHTNRKPIGVSVIIASIAALFSMTAILLGGMIWIISSMMQPTNVQLVQLSNIVSSLNSNQMISSSKIELTNMQVAGNVKEIQSTNSTIQWMLYEENIPKQVTELKKDIEYLKIDMNRLVDNVHNKN